VAGAPPAPAPTPAPQIASSGAAIGVNLSGLQMAVTNLRYGSGTQQDINYSVPRREDVQWLARQGYKKSRLPIQWEMLQPVLFDSKPNAATAAILGQPGAFDATYQGHVQSILDAHAAAGTKVILDLHNYCRYRDFIYQPDGSVKGLVNPGGGVLPYTTDASQVYTRIFATATGATLTPAHFTDFWTRAAKLWKDHPGFGGYGLMNEPYNLPSPGMTTESFDGTEDLFIWPTFARAAIDAIRALDPTGLIYLDSNEYSGAFSIAQSNPAWPIAGTNLIYEVHMYLDAGSSGQAYDYDTEVAKGFTAGFGPVPINLDTGVDRLKVAVDWATPRGVTLALSETGMPVDDPRWQEMFQRLCNYAHANNIEVYDWNGGNHWSLHNYGINHVPGWHQDRTLEPQASGVMKASAGISGATLFDDGPGYGPGGTPVTITVWARGNLAAPVTLSISASSGSLSATTLSLAAGANPQATFTFTPAANTIATLSYTVSAGSANAPAPRKVYSLADPVAYAATSLPDAAGALLAKYAAAQWLMADAYTDYLDGVPAAVGQGVRAVADSGWASGPGNAMEMLNWFNTERDPAFTLPVMREVNGKRCTDHSGANATGLWCRKVVPFPGVQPNPANRAPWDLQDAHFVVAAVAPGGRDGLVFQASTAEHAYAAELSIAGGRAVAHWVDPTGNAVTLTSASAVAAGTPVVISMASQTGAQRLRVNSVAAGSGSSTFATAPIGQLLIAWGFKEYYPNAGFGGQVFAVVTGKGSPTAAELGVIEKWLGSQAGL